MPGNSAAFWKGLGCHPIEISDKKTAGTSTIVTHPILQTAQFESWDEFDQHVGRMDPHVFATVDQQGCRKSHPPSDSCDGSFRNVGCRKPICDRITTYKAHTPCVTSTRDLADELGEYLLQGLKLLAERISPTWRGDVSTALRVKVPYKNSYRSFIPVLCVVQPGKSVPDVALCVRYPNEENLVLSQGSHSTLSSAYNATCVAQGDKKRPSFACNGIAQIIAYALCTRTGMGCLFNHNEAVFVKISIVVVHRGSSSSHSEPSSSSSATRTSSRSGELLKVQISRKYRCNTHPTSLHGLLAMMLLAFGSSSSSIADRNTRHLGKLIHMGEQLKRRG